MDVEDIPLTAPSGPPPLVVAARAGPGPFAVVDGLRVRRGPDRLAVELPVAAPGGTLWLHSLVRPIADGTAVTASCGRVLDGFWREGARPDPHRQPALTAARRGEPVVVPYFDVGFPVRLLRGPAEDDGTLIAYLLNGSVEQVWQVALPAVRPVCAAALTALVEWGSDAAVGELLRGVDDPAGLLGLRGPGEGTDPPRPSWR